jgi:hypothetical protein
VVAVAVSRQLAPLALSQPAQVWVAKQLQVQQQPSTGAVVADLVKVPLTLVATVPLVFL